jgi:uncharacterized protein (DUF779 family)
MPRVTGTSAAREAIAGLRAARGPVMFVQSGGCCGGTSIMCFPAGEFRTGDRDVLLGEVEGSPVYIDPGLDKAWGHPQFLLDVGPGTPEGFSLAAGDGLRFVAHTHLADPHVQLLEKDRNRP